jgi:hypothetical protein
VRSDVHARKTHGRDKACDQYTPGSADVGHGGDPEGDGNAGVTGRVT